MRENTDQNNSEYGHFHAVLFYCFVWYILVSEKIKTRKSIWFSNALCPLQGYKKSSKPAAGTRMAVRWTLGFKGLSRCREGYSPFFFKKFLKREKTKKNAGSFSKSPILVQLNSGMYIRFFNMQWIPQWKRFHQNSWIFVVLIS